MSTKTPRTKNHNSGWKQILKHSSFLYRSKLVLRIFWTGTKFNLTQIEVDKKVSIMFCALQTSNPPPCLYKRKYYLSWKTVCSTVYRFCSKS